MNLSTTLRTIARQYPDRPAITEEGVTLTYAAFEDRAQRIAGALRGRLGFAVGDRVGLWMENNIEVFPLMYGIWRAGLTAVPINNKLHPRELAWILDNSGARACFVTPDQAERLAELSAGEISSRVIVTGSREYAAIVAHEPFGDQVQDNRIGRSPALLPSTLTGEGPGMGVVHTGDGDAHPPPHPPPARGEGVPSGHLRLRCDEAADAAWLFYTSGTTGRPKGAVLTHHNLLFAVHCVYADIDFIGPDDTIFHAAPMSHGSGLYGLAYVAKGGHNVIIPGSFEPERIFADLTRYTNVSFFAAPTMVSRLINHPLATSVDTRNLKAIHYGGAAMYVADLKRALALFGPKLYQLFGQGESPMTITGLSKAMHADTAHPRYEARLASVGYPRTGVEVRVVDENGRDMPYGEIGEIVTRSDCVMAGYWHNPEANAKALRDGWLWTGDLGSLDADGLLTIKDRSKDMIISGGSNVYPREIEEVLATHEGVLECAVVSRPHADWGEEVIAFVVPKPGAAVTPADLDRLCLDNIARFKRPKGYRIVDTLPKNNYGKILKTDLRERLIDEK